MTTLAFTWLITAQADAAPGGDPQTGREVFAANCAMCHGDDASGMMGMHPSLRGAVERLSLEGVEVTIRKGRQTTPPMPAFERRLAEEQIREVIAYLDTLPPGPRNFGPGNQMGNGPTMGDNGLSRPQGMPDTDPPGMVVELLTILLVLLILLAILALLVLIRVLRPTPRGDRPAR